MDHPTCHADHQWLLKDINSNVAVIRHHFRPPDCMNDLIVTVKMATTELLCHHQFPDDDYIKVLHQFINLFTKYHTKPKQQEDNWTITDSAKWLALSQELEWSCHCTSKGHHACRRHFWVCVEVRCCLSLERTGRHWSLQWSMNTPYLMSSPV